MSKEVPYGKLLVIAVRIVDSPIDHNNPLTLNGEPVTFQPDDIVLMHAWGWSEAAQKTNSRIAQAIEFRLRERLSAYTFASPTH